MKRTPLKRRTPLRSKPKAPSRKVEQLDDEWRAARQTVIERDHAFCQAYGVAEKACWGRLHVHHILPRSRGGTHDPANLVTLCMIHHDWVHGNPTRAKELGLLR